MQQQQVTQWKEILAIKALQCIVNKMDQFGGRNVSKYIQFYAWEIGVNKILEDDMIANFILIIVPKIWGQIKKLKDSNRST